jgi:hypothetical protein
VRGLGQLQVNVKRAAKSSLSSRVSHARGLVGPGFAQTACLQKASTLGGLPMAVS